jgi:hypothetical protein
MEALRCWQEPWKNNHSSDLPVTTGGSRRKIQR